MSNGTVAADELRLLIERAERLIEEKDNIAADVRDVFGEAKARGYDPATMRAIIKRRKMEREKRQEQDALLATYCAALGLDYDGPEPSTPRASKVPTPLEEAIEKTGGSGIKSLEEHVGDVLEGATARLQSEGYDVTLHRGVKPSGRDAIERHRNDPLYLQAVSLVRGSGKASVSWLQRQLKIGYNQAAAQIEEMERQGIVSKPDATGKRDVRDLPALAQKIHDAGGRIVDGALVMPLT